MGEAGRNEAGENIGTMAAAIGDPQKVRDCVEEARQDGILVAANINAPTQTVVSGDRDAVARFTEIAKEARLRVTPLSVGSAFHSPMMEPASEKMRSIILTKKITPTDFPVYSNLTARPLSEYRKGMTVEPEEAGKVQEPSSPQTAEDIADAMALQLMSPVQWVKIVENLKAGEIDTVIEFGPGKTLSGLVKKIDRKHPDLQCGKRGISGSDAEGTLRKRSLTEKGETYVKREKRDCHRRCPGHRFCNRERVRHTGCGRDDLLPQQ